VGNKPYILGPKDQLDIYVADHDELKSSVTILPDGTVTIPQVGILHAEGQTVASLTRQITRELAKNIIDPDVSLVVHSAVAAKVNVLGAVKAPGQYDVTNDMHVMDALAAAGGPSQDASLTQVTLVKAANKSVVPVDIAALMTGADNAQNVLLAPGDMLLVQARSGGILQAQVTGEVSKPGAYPVPPDGITVVSLLSAAGGQLSDAALSEAQILHDGKAKTLDLRPMLLDLNAPVANTRIMPGDVLQVPANNSRIAVLGEVRAPATYTIPDGGTLSATSALVLAGGTTSSADSRKATIVRHDSNGQAIASSVNVDDLLRGKSGAENPILHPGDIIYVPAKGEKSSPLGLLPLLSLATIFRH